MTSHGRCRTELPDIGVSVWADETGALHVEAVNEAGGGEPRRVALSDVLLRAIELKS